MNHFENTSETESREALIERLLAEATLSSGCCGGH
jgi:hypothetical protein